ncbi:amylo-alpha-1,6-glucosidase [Homoserinibacter sp. GY 40078]|uniref:amylo-alpha-1,6-glucosidase n=1 Tax=Homoserinibacter sp. GY 40078 TaxID=2603275 RepID=UPI0011C8363E|nr:trehalase family glycosidase [Homoserinibacter sp. GY 40078]TXK18561.1 hypothetical protein FVQ89_00980 [Homoserinibacter sp. GY 40078]
MTALDIDLRRTPFSRRGSYLAVSRLGDGAYLRTVHGDAARRELVQLTVGGTATPTIASTPGRLTLGADGARLELALAGQGRAAIRVSGGEATLEFQVSSQYDVVLEERPGSWVFVASGARRNYRIVASGAPGAVRLEAGWDGLKDSSARLIVDASASPVALTIDEYTTTPPPVEEANVDVFARESDAEFAAWAAVHVPERVDDAREPGARLAAYVAWAALVPAGGALRRETMLMSKNHMNNVWAWDHCFNAIALWHDPAAAADQLLTLFDHQDPSGGIPDFVNDAGAQPNFVKPPVHGWAVAYLMDRDGLSDEALSELYPAISRWTDWWFAARDYRGDGIPSYNHGNDSGWDNSTVFATGVPVQSPDLLAFLATQMDALARMAERLGLPAGAQHWRGRADDTIELLIRTFWRGDRFVARSTRTGDDIASDSLLTLMPLTLGDRLPSEVFASMVDRLLTGDYLTERGIATEPTTSPYYEADGYWRGPVWAPTMMLLIDGLRRGGRTELAAELGERFLDTCAMSGMAENFDAVTGEGLRDLSMTWTASVYLALLDPHTASTAARAVQGTGVA